MTSPKRLTSPLASLSKKAYAAPKASLSLTASHCIFGLCPLLRFLCSSLCHFKPIGRIHAYLCLRFAAWFPQACRCFARIIIASCHFAIATTSISLVYPVKPCLIDIATCMRYRSGCSLLYALFILLPSHSPNHSKHQEPIHSIRPISHISPISPQNSSISTTLN